MDVLLALYLFVCLFAFFSPEKQLVCFGFCGGDSSFPHFTDTEQQCKKKYVFFSFFSLKKNLTIKIHENSSNEKN